MKVVGNKVDQIERKAVMRKRIVNQESRAKFLVISSLLAIPDKDVFSLYARRRNYQSHKSSSQNIKQYWIATGNYLREAMKEVESQVDSHKELASD